jgi:hypothetical protein
MAKKNPHAVALGRRGGLAAGGAGVKKYNASLTPEEKSDRGKKAARARWATRRKPPIKKPPLRTT